MSDELYENERAEFKQKVIDMLKDKVKECENSAEEYFQELGDEESGNAKLDEAAVVRGLIKFIEGL